MRWPTVRGEACDGWGLSAIEWGTALAAITAWEGDAVWIFSGCWGPAVETCEVRGEDLEVVRLPYGQDGRATAEEQLLHVD